MQQQRNAPDVRSGPSPATPAPSLADDSSDGGLSDSQSFVLRRLSGNSPVSVLRLADDVATEVSAAPSEPTAAYYELVSVALPQLDDAGVVEFDRERRAVELADRDVPGGGASLPLSATWIAVAGPLAVLVLLGGVIGASVLAGATLLSVVLAAVAVRHLGGGDDAGAAPAATGGTGRVPTDRRILELLLANGGRMKQQRIVESVDVSAASVSRHLSRLSDGGRIDKFPVGRENVVQLAGLEPLSELDDRA